MSVRSKFVANLPVRYGTGNYFFGSEHRSVLLTEYFDRYRLSLTYVT